MINRTTAVNIEQSAKHRQVAMLDRDANQRLIVPQWKLGAITEWVPITGTTNRWLYKWKEVRVYTSAQRYEPFGDADTLYNSVNNAGYNAQINEALNVNELSNTAAWVFPGFSPANLPAGVTVLPVQVDATVLFYQGYLGNGSTAAPRFETKPMWFFAAPNPVDGDCI